MKKLTKYQCELCKKLYDDEQSALNCEAKGKEEKLCESGQKILYRDDWNGGFGTCYDKIDVIEIKDYGHYLQYTLGNWENKYPYEYITGNEEFKDKCTFREE